MSRMRASSGAVSDSRRDEMDALLGEMAGGERSVNVALRPTGTGEPKFPRDRAIRRKMIRTRGGRDGTYSDVSVATRQESGVKMGNFVSDYRKAGLSVRHPDAYCVWLVEHITDLLVWHDARIELKRCLAVNRRRVEVITQPTGTAQPRHRA